MLTLASQRRLPSCISQSEMPSSRSSRRMSSRYALASSGLVRSGLADDFQKGRAGAIQIDQAVPAAALLVVQHFAGVFFQVDANDADLFRLRPPFRSPASRPG